MTIREMVIADYQEYIAINSHQINSDLVASLKTHERYPAFIESITGQICDAEKRLTITLNRQKIKEIVYSCTENFIWCVKKKAEKDQASQAVKTLDQSKQSKTDLFESMTDNMAKTGSTVVDEEMLEKLEDA